MHNVTFNLSDLHRFGSAFFDYLKLRKEFFVDVLNWDIPHDEHYEMDQYDNPTAWYSLVIRNGQVIGGTRVMPTTSTWGKHSYMLRDAQRGKLENIPRSAMPHDVVTPYVWEMTRLVISPTLRTAKERGDCLSLMGQGLYDIAESQTVGEYMGVSSVALVRVLRQLGFPLERMGDPYYDHDDGRKYAVLRMPVYLPNQELIAAE